MSTATKQTFSSTKDLNRTLGKKELMGIAIGQIIGAGVMSMMGVAIAMTGRSANLAFMLSAVFTMCTFFPSILHHLLHPYARRRLYTVRRLCR